MAFLQLPQFLLGQLLCLQMIKYVQEIQWTLLQFDISFYSVLVHFFESFKNTLSKCSLCLARVLPHTILSSWELAVLGTSEIIEVISCWKTSLAE